jgi:penicillin-binding protein 1A
VLKKILLLCVGLFLVGVLGIYLAVKSVQSSLPQLITVKDYQPLLVSQVFDRNDKKIGEFFRERRTLVPYEKIPKNLVNAFLAAEDDQFFQHKGINPQAIFRAALANLRAGRSVQGGSTITQQVAKTLLLTNEKTFTRKLRDVLLAIEMEKNLSKQDILYLYLNQIYFGQGAYGVEQAAQTYYRKTVSELTLSEMAVLAGLPAAPTTYSPSRNPLRAKERQTYVLRRMADVGFVSKEESEAAIKEPVTVYVRENYEEFAPFFLETVRQLLVAQLGEDMVLDKGLRIHTSLDLDKQKAAQESLLAGLKSLDKRQGYRGPLKNLAGDEIEKFLADADRKLILASTPERVILPNGKFAEIVIPKDANSKTPLPSYMKINDTVECVVDKVDDALGLVYLRLPQGLGLIDLESMTWARKPDPEVRYDAVPVRKPSDALKAGDVIQAKIVSDKFKSSRLAKRKDAKDLPSFDKYFEVELDQDPLVEGALISFDQQTQDILALIGGSNFGKSEFNRAIQAPRQTGSSFKAIVYASALDKGYTPATPIMDAPIVFEEEGDPKAAKGLMADAEGQGDPKVWKPANHSKSFGGDIMFRNALVQSLNIPAVKIIEDVGVPWATEYSKRLGIYSPLNPDFTLVLGSSSVTLYEMTKVFSEFGRLGKRMTPLLIHSVEDANGKNLLQTMSLDSRFEKELSGLNEDFEKRRKDYLEIAKDPTKLEEYKKKEPKSSLLAEHLFFDDQDQLIRPTTAYLMTSMLRGVIEDPKGTGARARSLGREVAGKTGTTNNYYDAWFIGYSPQISTGVWVGFDKEKSLGKGEVGGRSALPIWIDYMKAAHDNLPQMTFPVPDGIVFANIDSETGKLASAATKNVLRQAFAEGSEPTASSSKAEETTDFYKQDLSE